MLPLTQSYLKNYLQNFRNLFDHMFRPDLFVFKHITSYYLLLVLTYLNVTIFST